MQYQPPLVPPSNQEVAGVQLHQQRRDAPRDWRPFVACSSTPRPQHRGAEVGELDAASRQGASGAAACWWRSATGRPLKRLRNRLVVPPKAGPGTGEDLGAASRCLRRTDRQPLVQAQLVASDQIRSGPNRIRPPV